MKSSLNVALLGNKKDLKELRKVPQEEAHEFAEIFNWQYYEVSAAESDLVTILYYGLKNLVQFLQICLSRLNANIFTFIHRTN